jgi:hypothetical protein
MHLGPEYEHWDKTISSLGGKQEEATADSGELLER